MWKRYWKRFTGQNFAYLRMLYIKHDKKSRPFSWTGFFYSYHLFVFLFFTRKTYQYFFLRPNRKLYLTPATNEAPGFVLMYETS